jgi:oxysterol-binding protein 1
MRIASLQLDPDDKLRLEIRGKASVKYHLKANHEVEAKRWYWSLNNAIQWTKDEDKEEQKRQRFETDELRKAKMEQLERTKTAGSEAGSLHSRTRSALTVPLTSGQSATASSLNIPDESELGASSVGPSIAGDDLTRVHTAHTATVEGDLDDEEEYGDDNSSHENHTHNKDALQITAQSVRWQLDFLAQVSGAIQSECQQHDLISSNPNLMQAVSTYGSAVANLKDLVGKLLSISRDRDAYWQYRLDREINVRRMWEESMARVAQEQEELEMKIGESEDKRKKTKRALKDALDNLAAQGSQPATPGTHEAMQEKPSMLGADLQAQAMASPRKKSTYAELVHVVSDDESDDDEEFFDAVGAGDVEVVENLPTSPPLEAQDKALEVDDLRMIKTKQIAPSFHGYEDPIRKRLKMDEDNRPKVGLWVSQGRYKVRCTR